MPFLDVRSRAFQRWAPYALAVAASAAIGYVLPLRFGTSPLYVLGVFIGGLGATVCLAMAYNAPRASAFLLVALTGFVIDVRFIETDVTTSAQLNPQILIKFSVYAAALVTGLIVARRPDFDGKYGIVLLYLLIALISSSYSPSPFFSIAAAIILVSHAIIAFSAFSIASSREQRNRIWTFLLVALVVKLVASWGLAVVAPHVAFHGQDRLAAPLLRWNIPRFGGISGPNSLGLNATVAFVLALCLYLQTKTTQTRRVYIAIMLLAVGTLAATQSRTAILAFIAGGFAVVVLSGGRRLAMTTIGAAVVGAAAWSFSGGFLFDFATRGGNIQSLQTLEGRTSIWQAILTRISEAPFFGYGYGSARTVISALDIQGTHRQYYSAHNMIFESMLSFGIVGTSILAILLLLLAFSVIRLARTTPVERRGPLLLPWGLLAVLMVNGMAESGLAGVQSLQSLLLILIATHLWVGTSRPTRRSLAERPATDESPS